MTVAFELPDLGEGVAEGEVLAWHVEVGDQVEEDDVIAEVETDKAAVEVPSPAAGTIAELHAEVGEMVQTGSVLVTIDDEGEGDAGESDAGDDAAAESAEGDAAEDAAGDGVAEETTRHTFAPPYVRRLARELGVDIDAVEGSGPGGRVTEGDVREAAEAGEEESTEETESAVKPAVSRVGEGDGEADQEGAVKSAVKRVGDSDTDAGAGSPSGAAEGAADRDQTLATPATRKLARELGVDVDEIPTDVSRDGEPFVDEAAVRAYAAAQGETEADTAEVGAAGATAAEPSDEPTPDPAAGAAPEGAGPTRATTSAPEEPGDRREPYRGIRRRIGEQMGQGWQEVPHATHHDRVEVSELVDARERLAPLAADRDVELTYTPLVVKCVAAALEDHPIVNTHFDAEGEGIVFKEAIDVGVATATDRGLLVPVLEDADERGLIDLATELAEHVQAARDGSIDRSAMQGATFTVTNIGAIGGEYANPIVNVPQTAILATGSLRERPVVEDGEVVARPTIPLSLALDHRVIDGADAARFVNTLKTYLQDPTRLLLG